MDYNDYKKEMNERSLIESLDSVQCLANAIRLNNNLKELKSRNIVDSELIDLLNGFKDEAIKLAIRYAYDKEWCAEMFGKEYPHMINELIKTTEPTVAAMYGEYINNDIIEYHKENYPELY